MNNIIFEENQKFRQKWIWVLLVFCCGLVYVLFGWAIIQQIIIGKPWGSPGKQMSNMGLIIFSIIFYTLVTGLIIIFVKSNLKTIITKNYIHLKFSPFHLKGVKITKDEITSYEVKEYHPIKEFGGWGIRFRTKGKKAYNVSGNKGLELKFKNSNSLLVGTQKAKEINEAMKQFFG